ncbi:uncharacterized protein LOC124833152 [Vigna umbellata]|uniref:uncharacterized protein LOC124833152 n=1 Tax=Vigna umbellata TaxID=87088 RepID=UPI001F5F9418|nr:uncharacterized protein LOC124833152 [Vigna umbellata]
MTLDELQERVTKFIRIEEMRVVQKRQHEQNSTSGQEKKEGKRTFVQDECQKGQKYRDGPEGPKFERYTPLNAPRATILEEALSADLLPPLRPSKSSRKADETKHCTYHLNIGHTTKDCTVLRDKVEELIWAGHLRKFVKNERVGRSPPRRARTERTDRRDDRRPDHRQSRSRSRDRPLRGIINIISRGFAEGGSSASARKRSPRELKSVHRVDVKKRSMPPITFTDEDFHAHDPDQDDPMVITTVIARYSVEKVLIDQIVGFTGERVDTRGYLDLRTRLGTDKEAKELRTRFLLVEAHTPYNALLGRLCLNAFGAVVSTPHLALKFPSDKGIICTVRADQWTARECYNASLKVTPFVPPQTDRGAETTTS